MTFHDRGTTWFLAPLNANCANIADKNLKRQGFQTFLPMEEVTHQRNGKFVTATWPMFRGYISVAFDVARGFWRTENLTYGITQLVSFGKEPTAVLLDLVSQMMLLSDAKGKLLPPKLLRPSHQVTLTRGPFVNFVAEVERIAPDRRVWILMEIMVGAEPRGRRGGSVAVRVTKH